MRIRPPELETSICDVKYHVSLDARASGDTELSSPYWDLFANMHRVVNYHNSWVGQQQVELFDASCNRVWCKDEWVILISPYMHRGYIYLLIFAFDC
ncbi:hypothetical protein F511_22167 [Dorcoceras hygrometricum]|uniref:Uncharacterized protein n=1 Tax=Dorcoceras hygrometricum TaxID=472368 RepID=A0A2Z7C1J9_9LAMI|nr:hypothetical protein F511_22167 [Dorcoceras hygrometricum]